MPIYYNLTKFADTEGIMSIYTVVDTLMLGYFSLFLIMVLGIFITMINIKNNKEPIDSIMVGSFFALMMAIVLYISHIYYTGIMKPGLYIFVPAIIFTATATMKWYNK